MAEDNDAKKQEKKVKPATGESKKADVSRPVEVIAVKSTPPWPLITIGVFVSVLLFALFIIGWFVLAAHNISTRPASTFGGSDQPFHDRRGFDGERGDRMRGFGGGLVRGVVTEINGDNLTVAGNGKKVTVKMTSSTDVSGSESDLAVNDSVIVFGARDDDTVTASRIIVTNNAFEGFDGASIEEDAIGIPAA